MKWKCFLALLAVIISVPDEKIDSGFHFISKSAKWSIIIRLKQHFEQTAELQIDVVLLCLDQNNSEENHILSFLVYYVCQKESVEGYTARQL